MATAARTLLRPPLSVCHVAGPGLASPLVLRRFLHPCPRIPSPATAVSAPAFRFLPSLESLRNKSCTATHHDAPAPAPSILQFLRSDVWHATHRDSRPPLRDARRNDAPPPRRPRPSRPGGGWNVLERIPSKLIFWSIVVVNGVVFAAWQVAKAQYASGDRRLYNSMLRNFFVSWESVSDGRIWTILTCCFSHESLNHIFFNGFTFFYMAPLVLSLLGNTAFLALYFAGGIGSSCASLAWNRFVKHRNVRSHGASGAVYSIIAFFACVHPTVKFYIFGIVPVPAWAFVTGIIAFDGLSAVYDKRAETDTAAHLGGITTGIAYYIWRVLF